MVKKANIRRISKVDAVIASLYDGAAVSFIDRQRENNYSKATVDGVRNAMKKLLLFLHEDRGVARLQDVGLDDLEAYRQHMYEAGFSGATVENYMRFAVQFFHFLEEVSVIFSDPAAELINPRPVRRLLPVPTEKEVARLMSLPDASTALGIRDRAILETSYSTGLRCHELLSMTIFSADLKNRLVRIMGKGRKERTVPLGRHAAFWLERYFSGPRGELLKETSGETALWINSKGGALKKDGLFLILSRYNKAGDFSVNITSHSLRRACATHMLQNGAHPVQIQMLLGHSTLQILGQYLRLTVSEIRETHRKSRVGK